MNFEGFQDLMRRIARTWYERAKVEILEMDYVNEYLKVSPFIAKQTKENEIAYERLMDVRLKLVDLSFEIDKNHDAYMRFMQQALNSPDLKMRIGKPLRPEERNLIDLELMIMEQVADWELDVGKVEPESNWEKVQDLVVTLPNDSTQTIRISAEPQRRSWFGFCPVSMKIGSLKMCGGCKMVGYFGKDEQKKDWTNHKQICKAVTNLMKRFNVGHITEKLNGDQLISALSTELGRSLLQEEMDLVNFPRVCADCGKGGAVQDGLRNCSRCNCVSWCSNCLEQGRTKHEEWCHLLKTSLEDYKHEKSLGHQVQKYCPISQAKYKPLPASIEILFEKDVAKLVSNKLPGYQESELRYLTFLYTCPLTILYAAEQAGLAQGDIQSVSSLTIHLVGARVAEIRHLVGWEIIALRLPNLETLNLVFIGDEVVTGTFPPTFSYRSNEAQKDRPNLMVNYSFAPPQLYQDYVKTPGYVQPDIVAALDCGFKFYPSWDPCIPHLLPAPGVPCVFTEFTLQDTRDNLQKVETLVPDVEVLIPPRRNPFCSRRPVRCSDKTGNYAKNSVIFSNDYISVIRRKM
ncbi:uncharacterized protein LOC111704027 [Eurytemora carolleeae]|uniref:uncharacterized protein LOC111704027 n=1 Tax=Eurytemora carolleeae TaxID=1294199 RepID=UPI000C76EB56|nr:uncharacterized protein LOC111704027 [Eurytemora carolleeae]|eukprot:XP_023331908.1 uncharacterized protein LOC111704027 [Eurytemora affinis]